MNSSEILSHGSSLRLSKQWWGWWFETPSCPLWRQCNAITDPSKALWLLTYPIHIALSINNLCPPGQNQGSHRQASENSMIFQWYFKTRIPNFHDNYKCYKTEKLTTTCYTWSPHTSYDHHWVFLRKSVKCSCIPKEECVKQHYMVVCDFSVHIPRVKKRMFSPRIRTWKLRDPDTASLYQLAFKVKMIIVAAAVAIASGADADTANHVESAWSKLKGPLLDAATKVCGNQKPGGGMNTWTKLINRSMHSSRPTVPWRKEAWWRRPKTAYIDVKCVTKHAVWLTKSGAPQYPPDGDGVFRIAKQMDCRNQDIVVKNCVCNDDGKLALTDEDKMKAWVEHYARLLNVEFLWLSNELPEVPPTAAPYQCARDRDPQSTQQNEMQQGYPSPASENLSFNERKLHVE